MASRIQIRRDTSSNWTSANPVLAQGEIGFETDTYKLKIGDGVTEWNSLDYFVGDIGSINLDDVADGATYGRVNNTNLTGNDVDHTKILNIGIYDHSEIDTHIDETTIHFLKSDISLLDLNDTPSDYGSSGQVLTTDGSGNTTWTTAASGDVVGPSSSSDNAVVRWDGTTGNYIKDSNVFIDDSGNITTSGTVDGVDVSDFKDDYDIHVSDTTIHYTKDSILLDDLGDVVITTPQDGQLIYYDGSNWLNTNTIHVDEANHRVGIGTTTPQASLHIVDGSIWVFNDGANPQIIVGDNGSSGQYGYFQWDSANDYFGIETDGTNGLKIKNNNVSIGNIFPSQPFTVASGTTELFDVNVNDKLNINHQTVSKLNQYIHSFDSAGGQSVSTTETPLNLDNDVLIDDIYVRSGSKIKVNIAGYFKVSYNLSFVNTSSGWGSGPNNVKTWIRVNGSSNIRATTAYSYQNDDYDPYSTNSATTVIKLAEGDYFEVMFKEVGSDSGSETIGNESWVMAEFIRK